MSDSHFSSCFRPTPTTTATSSPETSPAPVSGNPNLTTCLYHTDHGLFTLTWSRILFGHSLHLHLDNIDDPLSLSSSSPLSLSTPSFRLQIKPFLFWKKRGSKQISVNSKKIRVYWDLRRAKFGSRPEPRSGFYVAVIIAGEMTLLAGDAIEEAYARTKAENPRRKQTLIQRREHVFGNRVYRTKAEFGGRARNITIESNVGDNNDDPSLIFAIDEKQILQVKHLKWKFRGNERIEVDGVSIQVSWDVYNWLIEDNDNSINGDGHALFMFRFEKMWFDEDYEEKEEPKLKNKSDSKMGLCGFENMNKKSTNFLKTGKSSFSSSSMSSSVSSRCNSSVMEWESMEEKELENSTGFSLLVYAWKT